jgi:class II lanthipeptide synthase
MSSDEFLGTAVEIGRRIVADAVWCGDRCNWVGVVMDPKNAWDVEYRALEPTIYDGTAGVGLYLAWLAALTDDATARRTALAALRQAMARAPAHPSAGLHAGMLGVAWAVGHVGDLLDAEELRAGARALTRSAAPLADGSSDVILGSAGSALARLALARDLDEPSVLDAAVANGEQLLTSATVTEHGWSWAAPSRRRGHHLCGLSHGAAGVAWTLLELFNATGDRRFRVAAEGAFAYERSWFDAKSGTWPDLRSGGERRGAADRRPGAMAGTWCHGEAGIALTRLRAAELLRDERYEDEAQVALATTRCHLAAVLTHDIDDLTLCHGAVGAADVLLSADYYDESAALGYLALERYAAVGRWPCGVPGGASPTLYRGCTGIGWWLLRLHNPAIPSPLALPLQLTATVARA